MSLTRSPTSPYQTATIPIFSSATRYAKHPIFNMYWPNALHNLSAGEIPDKPTLPTTKTGCMAHDRDVKKSPDSRRGKYNPCVTNTQSPPHRDNVDPLPRYLLKFPLPTLPHYNFRLCIRLMLLFISCIRTFLLSSVHSLSIIITNLPYIFHTRPTLPPLTSSFNIVLIPMPARCGFQVGPFHSTPDFLPSPPRITAGSILGRKGIVSRCKRQEWRNYLTNLSHSLWPPPSYLFTAVGPCLHTGFVGSARFEWFRKAVRDGIRQFDRIADGEASRSRQPVARARTRPRDDRVPLALRAG